MELNLIKYQYHCVTYSSETVVTDLNNIHVIQDPLIWTPNSLTSEEWIKINFYYLSTIDKIEITWNGACDYLKIEYSLDNISWETLSDTFVPRSKFLSIDYTTPSSLVFLKILVTNPVDFIIEDLDIYSDITWNNDDIISHNFMRAYGISHRDSYPLYPSMIKDMFRMSENYNNIDKKLFDSTIYLNTVVSCSVSTMTGQLTVTDLILDDDVKYYWDYDDINTVYVEGLDGSVDITDAIPTFYTDVDLSDYSVDELAGKYLVVNSGMNLGSYLITSHTNNSSGNEIVLAPLSYTLSNMNFKIQDVEESQLISNPNIIYTENPLVDPVSHLYTNSGTYYPRLLIYGNNYKLEFNTTITI